MIVCHCHAVTDREIRRAVQCGAADAEAVAELCGAGSDCGGCRPVVESIVSLESLFRAPRGGAGLRELATV